MSPAPESCITAYDFWYADPPDIVRCECLMPTGDLIPLEIPHDMSLLEIKEVHILNFVKCDFIKENVFFLCM